VPHIKPIVELCMALAREASPEDPLRYIKGLSHKISRLPIVVPHIKPIVELCMALAGEVSLEDPLRYIKELSHEISRLPCCAPHQAYCGAVHGAG
jgi:hypothetical protein